MREKEKGREEKEKIFERRRKTALPSKRRKRREKVNLVGASIWCLSGSISTIRPSRHDLWKISSSRPWREGEMRHGNEVENKSEVIEEALPLLPSFFFFLSSSSSSNSLPPLVPPRELESHRATAPKTQRTHQDGLALELGLGEVAWEVVFRVEFECRFLLEFEVWKEGKKNETWWRNKRSSLFLFDISLSPRATRSPALPPKKQDTHRQTSSPRRRRRAGRRAPRRARGRGRRAWRRRGRQRRRPTRPSWRRRPRRGPWRRRRSGRRPSGGRRRAPRRGRGAWSALLRGARRTKKFQRLGKGLKL